MLIEKILLVIGLLAVLVGIGWSQDKKPALRVATSASSTSVVVVEPGKESELSRKQAEMLDMCLRIYRYYGFVEVVPLGKGVAVCR